MSKRRFEFDRYNTPKRPPEVTLQPQFEMAAWSPDPDGKLPAEQVHLIIHWPAELMELPPMIVRFKSPDTLGFVIEELTRYRRQVWPESVQLKNDKRKD